mmetsp:Transcript_70055/g.194680  ORF Transcript_70055/g.194680 Transcript_70055/m.194680 type:complete len:713 (-) Transcript_70055:294-2432(-)|eukprot:CAMPEP_0117532508 /NCGR_PEP_ID=MMETSP0784-20121206/39405_1 /TAXON_ID=39447 /ORGANISM="" /LENGTH=712 /DNA_ID=CAMNT_0005328905 /DNA_START=15 /DNA_END=2153 /DNA_ORIENTATION=+
MAEKRDHTAAFGQGEPPQEEPSAHAKPTETINPLTGSPYSQRFHELLETRRKLPCWAARQELLTALKSSQVVVLVGEPGSGKTTQLPQILLDAGYHVHDGKLRAIVCAQPHGTSATSAAHRVTEELEVPLGSYVGYTSDFDNKTSQETLLKFTTHHLLLRELLMDPLLDKYSVVLLDELHARTQAADVFCGILKEVLRRRPELRLIVLSAHMDVRKLRTHFDGAPVLTVPTRRFPVEILYTEQARKDYVKAAVDTVLHIHSHEGNGDILVFLTSEDEVESACLEIRTGLSRASDARELSVVPFYAALPISQQQRVFDTVAKKEAGSRSARKVIVATDLAETSIAIDNVVFVVDTGFSLQRVYNPRNRLDSSLVVPVSKASSSLRAGCAGRASPGKCFRLYPEKVFKELVPETHPEMMRSNVSSLILLLKSLGADDFVNFEFVDPPAPETLMRALESLNYLGFLDDSGVLTQDGERAVKIPVDPQLAKMLIESPSHRCSNEALSIAAMLTTQTVFLRPKGSAKQADEARSRFAHLDGDHLTLLNVFHAYKQQVQDGSDATKFCTENFVCQRSMKFAEHVREQLKQQMEELGLPMVSTDFQDKEYYPNIRKCIIAGFFMQAAYLSRDKTGGTYLTMRDNQEAALHPFTCLQHKPDWIVYNKVSINSRYFLRVATQVRVEWLVELAPKFFDVKTFPKCEAKLQLEKIAARRAQAT